MQCCWFMPPVLSNVKSPPKQPVPTDNNHHTARRVENWGVTVNLGAVHPGGGVEVSGGSGSRPSRG